MTTAVERTLGRRTVAVLRGQRACQTLRARYDELALRCGQSVTARASWTFASLTEDPGHSHRRPWAVTVTGRDGRLQAAVVLLDETDEAGRTLTTLAGEGAGYVGGMPAVDDASARTVAESLAGLLAAGPARELRLGPVGAGSPVLLALAPLLDGSTLQVDWVPCLRRHGSTTAEDYLSHGTRRTLRKAANRLRTDGLDATIEVLTHGPQIEAWIPRLVAVARASDHAHGRPSPLDDPRQLQWWTRQMRTLTRQESVELAVLVIDGRLAGYVLGIADGLSYRVLEGRSEPGLGRYAPGRVLETAVLTRVLEDPWLEEVDWMTPLAPESLLAWNNSNAVVSLHAQVGAAATSAPRGSAVPLDQEPDRLTG